MMLQLDVALAGGFAFAAVHYGVQWWFSRSERVILVFAVQCALYVAFCVAALLRYRVTTIDEMQTVLDHMVSIGIVTHGFVLYFYATLGARRDRVFLGVVVGALAAMIVINQFAPLRGTVTALHPMDMPGGGTALLPIRTSPGLSLCVLYLTVLAIQSYGFFIALSIWKRDRIGGLLVSMGSLAIVAGSLLAFLIDFAHLKALYVGALPHVIFVISMAVFLSRQHSARVAQAALANELRVAKEHAERASSAKSQFVAQMSHEIRTPLSVMMTYAQLLQRDATLSRVQRDKVDIMFTSGKHLGALLNTVLELSRIEAGRMELVETPFELGATLDEIEQMFAAQCTAKGITLVREVSMEIPGVLIGDGGKVKQILINLVGNAVKFTRRGSIHVSATASKVTMESMRIQFVVKDTGIGIAAADFARVFLPFEQLGSGSKAGGTGLGLAISLAHARLMGGDLTVESTPDVGSTFTVTFVAKRISEWPDTVRGSPLASQHAARTKALVVDDLTSNREGLAELLSLSRFETRAAADAQTALAIHAEWKPDLVLMDLRMPEIDGLEAIRRLRAAGSTAAIGVVSASALAHDEREALAIGADFFMRKPYSEKELLEHITRVLSVRSKPPGSAQ